MLRILAWVGTFIATTIFLAVIARWCFGRTVFSQGQNLILILTGIVVVSFLMMRGLHAWLESRSRKPRAPRRSPDAVAVVVDRDPVEALGAHRLEGPELQTLEEIERQLRKNDALLADMLESMDALRQIGQAAREFYLKYRWQIISLAVFLAAWAALLVYAAARHQPM
jgi:hypothetical protein